MWLHPLFRNHHLLHSYNYSSAFASLPHSWIVCLTRQSRYFLLSFVSAGLTRGKGKWQAAAHQSAIWLNYSAHGLFLIFVFISSSNNWSLIACSYRAKLSRNVSSLNDQSKSEDWKIRFEQERDDAIRAEADLSRRRSSGRFTSQIEQVISVKFLYSHNIDLIIWWNIRLTSNMRLWMNPTQLRLLPYRILHPQPLPFSQLIGSLNAMAFISYWKIRLVFKITICV